MAKSIEQRVKETRRSLAGARALCWTLTVICLLSAPVVQYFGNMSPRELMLFFCFRSLPLALIFAILSIFVDRLLLRKLQISAAILPLAEHRKVRMVWTAKNDWEGYFVEFLPLDTSVSEPFLRAKVRLDARTAGLRPWIKEADLYLSTQGNNGHLLCEAGGFLLFGRIVSDERPPNQFAHLAVGLLLAAGLFGFVILVEAGYQYFSGQ